MPTATPTWRKVSLIPAAIPLRSLGTTLSATSAITGFSSPTPPPRTRKPPSRVVHSDPVSIPDISSRPPPATPRPVAIMTRAGIRESSAPAMGAARKLATVRGR
jgi:hypothetical protein